MSMWKTILSHAVHVAAMYPTLFLVQNKTSTESERETEKAIEIERQSKSEDRMRVRKENGGKKTWNCTIKKNMNQLTDIF